MLYLLQQNFGYNAIKLEVLGAFLNEGMDSYAHHEKHCILDFMNEFGLIRLDSLARIGEIVDLGFGGFWNDFLVKIEYPFLPMVRASFVEKDFRPS